jgi:hypothetical protein
MAGRSSLPSKSKSLLRKHPPQTQGKDTPILTTKGRHKNGIINPAIEL